MKKTAVLVLLALLVLGMALPAACQDEFVRIQGDQFTYKGQPIRMKGTNYYPKDHMWANMWASSADKRLEIWNEELTESTFIRQMGLNCVRILVPYSNGGWGGSNPPEDHLQQLEDLVNMLGHNGIRSCITLFDWDTSFPDKNTDPNKFNDHISYLTTIVNHLKDNKYVFIWDVKNEPDHPANLNGSYPSVIVDAWDDPRTTPGKKAQIVNWLREMCLAIKGLDPNHPVSAGVRWYENVKDVLPFVDVAIYHSYWRLICENEITTVKAAQAAQGMTKPILVQEFGWPTNPSGSGNYTENEQLTFYQQEFAAFQKYNIAGCIQWMTFDRSTYGTSSTFEDFFGLWRVDYSLKPGGQYYRDNFLTTLFPYTDITPPAQASGLKAEARNGAVALSWNSPLDRDLAGAMVRCSTTGYPQTITDGALVTDVAGGPGFQGLYVQGNLANGTTYYYSVFTRDTSGNYSPPVNVSATPVVPTVVNLLANGFIDSVTGGVADSWNSYKINDPANAIGFFGASNFVSMPISQGIQGIDSASLPANSTAGAGIYQVVRNVAPGKTYMFTGMQDIFTDAWSAAGWRYIHCFGINPTGGTDPGAAVRDGSVASAKWMGSGNVFWNKSSGGAPVIGGFHRTVAAYTAENTTISVWSGVTIATEGTKDTKPTQFDIDSLALYEIDNPINYSNALVNPGFEQFINLNNGNDVIPIGWAPVGGSIGTSAVWDCNTTDYYSGSRGAKVYSRRGHMNMGYEQRVSTRSGTPITFSVWTKCTNADDSATAFIGVDPYGGTDITSSSIVWTSTRSTSWTPLSVSTTAQAASATLYLRGSTLGGGTGGNHGMAFDGAALSWTPSDSIAPTNPTYANELNGVTSGHWTCRNAPNFVFGGAADTGGSGVASYDVYFGTDPAGMSVYNVTTPAYQAAQLVTTGTYYLRVRAKDAAGNAASSWTTLFTYKYDATPPMGAPSPVTTSSAYIIDGKITLNWKPTSDPESTVTDYLYAVGTTSGGTDTVGWTSAGLVTSKEIEVPGVQPGRHYFITVKARNGAGADGLSATAAGWVTGAATDPTIAASKLRPSPEAAALKDKVVTAVFSDRFYIEETNRSSGIGVVLIPGPGGPPAVGDIVDVVGLAVNSNDGERTITQGEFTVKGHAGQEIKPLGMSLMSLGGGTFGCQQGVKAYTAGQLMGALGISNVGMLVKVFGEVTFVDDTCFYISDGSMISDSLAGPLGVRVIKPAGSTISQGQYAAVTGISGCLNSGGNIFRQVRPTQIQVISH